MMFILTIAFTVFVTFVLVSLVLDSRRDNPDTWLLDSLPELAIVALVWGYFVLTLLEIK